MQMGSVIIEGPKDWQIIQQENGKADLKLSGIWRYKEKLKKPRVYVRIVREDTGETVIPWQGSTDDGNGKWKITLTSVPAGGLYRIESCLNQDEGIVFEWAIRGDMIHHVGIGDIYIIAGQSNSAGYGKDPVYDPPELGVHLLKNNGKWDLASHPMNESTNTIHPENTETANPGHSPYLSFAKYLKRETGYPIGLIQTALGGSPLSAWNPEEDGTLYRNMLKIIAANDSKIRGVLWYQGCADAIEGLCDTYLERFRTMVSHFRKDLKNKNLPIITVQLNRYVISREQYKDSYWGIVKEAQRQAAMQLENVFVIPANDSLLSDSIHNSSLSNLVLGERIARIALSKIYGKNLRWDAPNLSSARKIAEDKVLLSFDNVYGRLYDYGIEANNLPFTFEDEKGNVSIKNCELIEDSSLLFTMDRKIGKCKVHGAFEKNPKSMIPVDYETHLPMLSFYNVEVIEEA